MHILFIDNDPVQSALMIANAEKSGHSVVHTETKQGGIEILSHPDHIFDVVILDPSPLHDGTQVLYDIKRHAHAMQYVIGLNRDPDGGQFKTTGYHRVLDKPVAGHALADALEDAERFLRFQSMLSDSTVDFPSAGGVIAKSAFYQLFISAIDRSGRYSEQNSVITITIDNYNDIADVDGAQTAKRITADLSGFLGTIRRQSDIIGQSAVNQFTLLLQRPLHASEPLDAAKRFTAALQNHKLHDNATHLTVDLIQLPSGHCPFSQSVSYP